MVLSERLIVVQSLLKGILASLRLHIRVPPRLDQLRAGGGKRETSNSGLNVLLHVVGGVLTRVPPNGPTVGVEEEFLEVEGDPGDFVGIPEGLAQVLVEGVRALAHHVDLVEDEGVGVLPEAVLLVVLDADDSVFVGLESALLGGKNPYLEAFGAKGREEEANE